MPEVHLAALVAGAGLHLLLPTRLPFPKHLTRVIGWPMLLAGIGLVVWAVRSAGTTNVDEPDALISNGAYALSRNPMYVGWSAGILGIGLITRAAWLVIAWAVAAGQLHREILGEEERLVQTFGPAYEAYRDRVPRYIGPW